MKTASQTELNAQMAFPPLPYLEGKKANDTLHLYLQIVGKIRLALFPKVNHWWHVTLYVSSRGLTTRPIPYGDSNFEIEFDFIDHTLVITTSEGKRKDFSLVDGLSVSKFYKNLFTHLTELGIDVKIKAVPYKTISTTPFAEDEEHATYDKEYIGRFFNAFVRINNVFEEFRGRFIGKSTPVQLFWHSFDLAHTRFSGKEAPKREGANRSDREAYSHEVISVGFWCGDQNVQAPAFYSYTAPAPSGLTETPLRPESASWKNGMAVLMYDDVRVATSPRAVLLDFLESAYLAGATKAGWDIEAFKLKPV